VNDSPDYSSSKFRSLNISHKFFDADDVSEEKIANYVRIFIILISILFFVEFPECVEFIKDGIDSQENVLVHCRQGKLNYKNALSKRVLDATVIY